MFVPDQVPAPIHGLIQAVRELPHQQPATSVERANALAGLHELANATEAAFLATLAEFDANGDGEILHGAQTTAAWLRDALSMGHGDAAERVRLARSARHLLAGPVELMRAGAVSYDQVRAIDQHTRTLPEASQAPAVQILTQLATQADVTAVRTTGHKLRATLDPDGRLSAAEKDYGRRHLTLSPMLDGMTDLSGLLDAEAASLLTAALAPHLTPTGPDDHRTPAQRRADGLVDILSEGHQTNLQVLVPARGPAELPDAPTPNKYLSDPALDRLACNPVITPVLLDSDGGLLDLGRSQRLFTATQHKALALRDAGCRFPGCNRPPAHTDAHHISPWADGGPTTMQNGLLLCRYHHRKVHQESWTISTTSSGGDGPVTFTNPHTGSQHTTSPRGP